MAQKKKVTIEKLAMMMQNGLVEVHENMNKGFARIHEELNQKADKSDINEVINRIGRLTDKIDDDRAAQATTKRQVEKHERWHYQTAEKVGIKLED